MFCENCGKHLHEGDRFCSACGYPVGKLRTQSDEFSTDQIDENQMIRRAPEPEYRNDRMEGMGYGFRMEKQPEVEEDDDDDDRWEKEERKEKITFVVLGLIIVCLVVAIVFGVVKLMGAGTPKEEKIPQLNEQMKEDLEKSQQSDLGEESQMESADAKPADVTAAAPVVTATPEPTQEISEPTEEPVEITVTPTPTPEETAQEEVSGVEVNTDTSTNAEYVIPDSSSRYLTNADLASLTEWQIRIARNEIYARHGRIFKTNDLNDYFKGKSWYQPSVSPEKFDNSYLNTIEIENVKLITEYEKIHNMNQ